MKYINRIYNNIIVMALVIVLLSILTVSAQQPLLRNSLLWEVSGNGLKRPSYLFGTIHMLCAADLMIPEKVRKAFNKSSQLVMEVDTVNSGKHTSVQQMLADVPISKKLSLQDYIMVDSMLQHICGLPLKLFDHYKLTTILFLLMQKLFPCAETKSYEAEFLKMAKEKKWNIISLETFSEQFALLHEIYSDAQILYQIKTFNKSKKVMQQLIDFYKKADLNNMYKYMTSPEFMDAHTFYKMLEVRNYNWMKKIPGIMKQSSFIVVGAAHLAGPVGLIQLLRAKGYTIKPVMN